MGASPSADWCVGFAVATECHPRRRRLPNLGPANMNPRISIIICTCNRSSYLRKILGALAIQTLSAQAFEILVVDNASTDDTPAVARGEFAHLANLRYLYHAKPGANGARNFGWRQARTPLVAYLDDDALPWPQWVQHILEAFETVRPMPGAVGGIIEPIWESSRPAWLDDGLLAFYTIWQLPGPPRWLGPESNLYLANLAFARRALEQTGGFREGFGRVGGNLISGEEMDLQNRMRACGWGVYYQPDAAVYHHIQADRISRTWLRRRVYAQGVTDGLMLLMSCDEPRPTRWKLGYWGLRRLLRSQGELWSLLRHRRDDPQLCYRQMQAWRKIGYSVAGFVARPPAPPSAAGS